MSEANGTVVQEKPKKRRHSLWWLNLLLTLVVFAGGVILGLRLNTMPEPYALVNRFFPQLVAQSGIAAETPAVEVTPAPTPTPAAAEVPMPVQTIPPAEAPKAEEPAKEPEKDEDGWNIAVTGGADMPAEILAVEEETPAGAEPADETAKETVGVDAALEAALERAGVPEDEAEIYGVFKSKDDDMTVYQVEFAAKGAEYIYFVNAFTAEIEGWRTVRGGQVTPVPEAEEPAQEQGISIEEAKTVAFRHAGVENSEATHVSVELRNRDGMSWYEITFRADGYSYTYRVDHTKGNILFYDRSK